MHFQIGHLKPQLSEPLEIGVWNVYVILDYKIIVKLNFLVTPLTHWRNRPIGHEKAREVNRGPLNPYHVAKDQADKWLEFLRPHFTTTKDIASHSESEVLLLYLQTAFNQNMFKYIRNMYKYRKYNFS